MMDLDILEELFIAWEVWASSIASRPAKAYSQLREVPDGTYIRANYERIQPQIQSRETLQGTAERCSDLIDSDANTVTNVFSTLALR